MTENIQNKKWSNRWDQPGGVHQHHQARPSATQHPGEDLSLGVMRDVTRDPIWCRLRSDSYLFPLRDLSVMDLWMTEAIPEISQSHLHVFTCYGCTLPLSLPIISFSTIFKNINVENIYIWIITILCKSIWINNCVLLNADKARPPRPRQEMKSVTQYSVVISFSWHLCYQCQCRVVSEPWCQYCISAKTRDTKHSQHTRGCPQIISYNIMGFSFY